MGSLWGRGWPRREKGLVIGLYGGSFNPPHDGHVRVSELALKRLHLDALWWLVTPGNPLKESAGLPPLETRITQAKALLHDPRIVVTGIEALLGTRFTLDTIKALKTKNPGVRFVWIMGADNLASFHRWRNWRLLASLVPIAVIDRPGASLRACHSPAALALGSFRRRAEEAPRLAGKKPPAWVYLHGLKSTLSSTSLRRNSKSVEKTS